MADDRTSPVEPERIDTEQDAARRYWSEKLGVPQEELTRAVQHVGNNVEDVKRFLSKGPGNMDADGASHWRALSGL